MKIIKPNHLILIPETPYKHIEMIGRTCYKSTDMITADSAISFVRRLAVKQHGAMLEHFRFIVEVPRFDYDLLIKNKFSQYITFTDYNRYVISTSARGFNDMLRYMLADDRIYTTEHRILKDIVCAIIEEYDCKYLFDGYFIDAYDTGRYDSKLISVIKDFAQLSEKEYNMHAWYSVLFTCDRGVSHESVRHRDASFAQESTRYCNYNNGKFGGEITVIEPFFFDKDEERVHVSGCDWKVNKYDIWYNCMVNLDNAYRMLIELGATPQEARTVLPNSLKTEIVITAQVYEWNHVFDLRVLGITGAPHPQMDESMRPVYDEMVDRGYVKRRD